MNVFKRGKTYWCEFVIDKKRHEINKITVTDSEKYQFKKKSRY